MADWHISRNGQKHGPYSEQQMQSMAAAGQIVATDLVWREGMANWVAAGSVPGLLPVGGAVMPTGAAPQPPTGYPAPGGYPAAGYPQGGFPQPRAGNAAAVCSLVFSLIFCIPVLTQLVGILCGIVGIRKANRPDVQSGKGLAIAGLMLSLLFLLGWVGLGVAMYPLYQMGKQAAVIAQDFGGSMKSGQLDEAMKHVTSDITRADLEGLRQQVSGWGEYQDFDLTNISSTDNNGVKTVIIDGTAKFSQGGNRKVHIEVRDVNGTLKISKIKLE